MPISMQLQERLNRLAVCLSHGRRNGLLLLPHPFFKGKALGTRLNLSSLFVALGGGKTHSIAIQLGSFCSNVAKQAGRFLLPVLLNLK